MSIFFDALASLLTAALVIGGVSPVQAASLADPDSKTCAVVQDISLSDNISYADNGSSSDISYPAGNITDASSDASSLTQEEVMKQLHEMIVSGFKNHDQDVDISGLKLEYNTENSALLQKVYSQVRYSEPELYYIGKSVSFEYISGQGGSMYSKIKLSYSDYPYNDVKFKNAISTIESQIDTDWSDVRKALFVHDYLITHTEYSSDTDDSSVYTAYGCLVNGNAVCEGYSLAYKLILNDVGVKCDTITSDENGHEWNMVTIDGNNYYVDITNDDPINCNMYYCSHDNFMLSRSAFQKQENHNYSKKDWIDSAGQNVYEKKTDASYENAFWKDCNSKIISIGDKAAYVDNIHETDPYHVYLYDFSSNTTMAAFENTDDYWEVAGNKSRYYVGNFVKLETDGRYFYFNSSNGAYRLAPDGTYNAVALYSDEALGGRNIYGLQYLNKTLYLYAAPDYTNNTENAVFIKVTLDNDESDGEGSASDETGEKKDTSSDKEDTGSSVDKEDTGTSADKESTGTSTDKENTGTSAGKEGTGTSADKESTDTTSGKASESKDPASEIADADTSGTVKTTVNDDDPDVSDSDPDDTDSSDIYDDIEDADSGDVFSVNNALYTLDQIYYDEDGNINTGTVIFTGLEESRRKVVIPDYVNISGTRFKVTSIDNGAFKYDSKLFQVKIGNNVKSIGSNAFSGCKNLSRVIIGSGLRTVGSGAFAGDSKLKLIKISSRSLKKINKNSLRNVKNNCRIYVPRSRYSYYYRIFRKSGYKGNIRKY
ncbi:MAG: leucine-rich repeat protein [Lachnospiraceae bacterium]|jgi:hypothetical protein|nr:leucine-rich repeat protein [Lachnospiraceae bacterium]MEE3461952.1 leucine-rich repeat protein [Lachnospiraceae bacterium]